MHEGPEGTSTERFLTFHVGPDRFAVDADAVREILRVPDLTRVPMSPAALAGLANLRGAALPVVDLARILRGAEPTLSATARVVVVEAGGTVGLMVDRVAGFSTGRHPAGDDDASQGETPSVQLSEERGNVRLLDVARLLANAFPNAERRTTRVEATTRSAVSDRMATADDRVALVSFALAGRIYALPIHDVDEVMDLPADVVPLTPANDTVVGMVGLRDRVLPLLSLADLLGLAPTHAPRDGRRIVVMRTGTLAVGLVVDAMGSILRPSPSMLDPVPRILKRGGRDAIETICRLDGGRVLVSVLAAPRLFDEDAVRRLSGVDNADERPDHATGRDGTMLEQFVVFDLDNTRFGLPIGAVSEVVRVPETITRLPKAPAFVEGVMNLRGTVVPVIDQRRRFDLAPAGRNARQRILVLETGSGTAGFLVDGVSRILRFPADAVRPAPELVHERGGTVTRVATLPDGTFLLLVDPAALLDVAERAAIEDITSSGDIASSTASPTA